METPELKDLIDIPGLWERVARVEERLFEASASEDPFLTGIAQHLLAAGGKRFRPVLAQLAGEFGPSRDRRLIDAGAAVELIHIGSLYHDDVIDQAQVRRGAASVNANWSNTVAILAGDFLMARASEVAAATLGQEAVRLLARTYAELVEGQTLELRLTGGLEHGPEEYYRVIGGKTASLIRTSARLGAMAADAPASYTEAASAAARELGMVFQIADDVLDLVATEQELGKPAGSDIQQGVFTLPVLHARRGRSGPRIGSLLEGGFPYAAETVREVIGLVREGGHIDEALGECRSRLAAVREALSALPEGPARRVLSEMGGFLMGRVEAARS